MCLHPGTQHCNDLLAAYLGDGESFQFSKHTLALSLDGPACEAFVQLSFDPTCLPLRLDSLSWRYVHSPLFGCGVIAERRGKAWLDRVRLRTYLASRLFV